MTRFAYALGRVLVLEGRLMGAARLDRLTHAADHAERLRVLAETEYAGLLDHAGTREEIEAGILRRVETALELLEESRAGAVARFFRLPYDLTNVKVALRRDAGDDLPFVDLGAMSRAAWEQGTATGPLAELLEEARTVAARDGSAAATALVDARGLVLRLEEAHTLGDRLAVELARFAVDAANVRVLSRGASTDQLVSGGRHDPARLLKAFADGGLTSAAGLMMEGAPSLDGPVQTDAFATTEGFEVLVARGELALARQGRLATATSQPVVAWMASIEIEARLVRLIVLGCSDGIPRGTVRDRIAAIHG